MKVRVHRGGTDHVYCYTPVAGGLSECPEQFLIRDVMFEIDETRRQYAIDKQRSNTHAFAVGALIDAFDAWEDPNLCVFKYIEPHTGRFELEDGTQIYGGEYAVFRNIPMPVALVANPVFLVAGGSPPGV